MTIIYRSICPNDKHEVMELFTLLGARYEFDKTSKEANDLYDEYLLGINKVGFIAEDTSKKIVAGVLLVEICKVFSPTMKHMRADGMVVHESYRGKWVYSRLLDMAFKYCYERNITSFMLKASNPSVANLYRRKKGVTERGVYFYHDPVALT